MKARKTLAALSLLAVCSAAPVFAASTGVDTTLSTTQVWGLDWNYGNALAVNSIPLPVSPNGTSTKTFQLLYQASLSNLNDINGDNISNTTGLNSSYEITTVMSFAEKGSTSVGGGAATAIFNVDKNNTTIPNFVYMYKGARDSNALAGTGYNNGNLFLRGHIIGNEAPGSFTTVGATEDLDKFGVNNWVGTKTVVGNGSSDVVIVVDEVNQQETVFSDPSALLGQTLVFSMFFNTSNVDPFRQTNPSQQFYDGGGFHSTNVGATNGLTGPDFIFQSDGNAAFDVATVPEPSTFLLSGLGLLLAGGYLRRRRNA